MPDPGAAATAGVDKKPVIPIQGGCGNAGANREGKERFVASPTPFKNRLRRLMAYAAPSPSLAAVTGGLTAFTVRFA